ncbi:MAG TPA: hypothetical protein VJ783_20410 [Pirellulales bacterium]|nr:hypothetical protein [Pirellulales bacterium]
MSHQELEADLAGLGRNWPVSSVADAVMRRIQRQGVPQRRWPLYRRRRVLLAIAASLLVAVGLPAVLVVGTPHTLQAQVVEALKQASAAHLIISTLDEQGVRRQAEIWYSRDRGFRLESPDETIVDDGKQQWAWPSKADGVEPVVVRRASPGTAAMIGEMLQLGDAPADWQRQRAKDHDRPINGQNCEAFVVVPLAPPVVANGGADAASRASRFIVWQDSSERIVRIDQQRQFDGDWRAGREISIDYELAVPADKFVADFPAKARVIDADRALAERFPLDRALVTAESGGLLFAVHEARRGEDETWYLVSSVRGTPEYLKKHPPQRRRFNLQTTLLDVAEQPGGPGIDSLAMHRAVMATAEMDGVHYLWWLAVRRRFFAVENGVRTPLPRPLAEPGTPFLEETEPGRLNVVLTAHYRGARSQEMPPRVAVTVPLAEPSSRSFLELADGVRRDILPISKLSGVVASLLGGVQGNAVDRLDINQATSKDIADAVVSQIKWLRDLDEFTPRDLGDAEKSN